MLLKTIRVSNFVGAGVGERDGAGVGDSEGAALGDIDGNDDGAGVGDRVGEHVSNRDHTLPTNLDAEKNNSSSFSGMGISYSFGMKFGKMFCRKNNQLD